MLSTDIATDVGLVITDDKPYWVVNLLLGSIRIPTGYRVYYDCPEIRRNREDAEAKAIKLAQELQELVDQELQKLDD